LTEPSVEERIKQYRPLIQSRARSWWRGWLARLSTVEDLEAVATEAVWRAVQTFREDRNAKFGTYLQSVINHALGAAAKQAQANKRRAITATLSEGPDGEVPLVLVARDANPAVRFDMLEMRRIVREAVDALPPRLADIIERRFWRDETLEVIGSAYSLTRERIRQLEAEAFRMLRPRLMPLWIGMPQEEAA
jgi:RNA polymerase sigma factor (sigma-70 family)